jgi:hypothetical protein
MEATRRPAFQPAEGLRARIARVTYFMADSLWLGTSHTRTPRIDRRVRRQHYHLSGRAGVTGCAPVGDRIINPRGG